MKKIVLVSGGFDPLHSGHLAYFSAAKKLGDELWVGVNSDAWLTRKKGSPFMNFEERTNLIKNLQMVDQVLSFEDDELGSSNCCIEKILSLTGSNTKIIVANGGDRNPSNIPEVIKYGDHPRVEFAWGVGGDDKKNSSSWILKSWNQPTTERPWGRYTVLNKGNGWQVKQLEFDSGKSLSNQRHFKRSEHWHVVEGIIQMTLEKPDGAVSIVVKGPGESIDIPKLTWHKATNIGNATARVIEVWMGTELTENDIERRNQ
jgi:cytidyltransferase-like protein